MNLRNAMKQVNLFLQSVENAAKKPNLNFFYAPIIAESILKFFHLINDF